MKGIDNGYRYLSPFEALTDAMITQITSSMERNAMMKMPIIIKQRGIARTIYSNIDN